MGGRMYTAFRALALMRTTELVSRWRRNWNRVKLFYDGGSRSTPLCSEEQSSRGRKIHDAGGGRGNGWNRVQVRISFLLLLQQITTNLVAWNRNVLCHSSRGHVRNQCIGRAVLPLQVLEENPFWPLEASLGTVLPQLEAATPSVCFHHHVAFSSVCESNLPPI